MKDFKVLIIYNDEYLIKEFEVHNTDEDTISDIVESYMNTNFNYNCKAFFYKLA